MKVFKWIALVLGAGFLVLICVLGVRTAVFRSRQISVAPVPAPGIDTTAAKARMSRAIQIKTISHQVPALFDAAAFREFHAFLEQSFPLTHQKMKRELVSDYSLLYTWPGSDPAAKAIVLMGHFDVVPVEPGTEEKWTRPAFSGVIADGFIWGRGAIDDKVSVMGLMEAAEHLLARGFEPKRTIYFSFGHDEELGGARGAIEIAKLLESRGVKAEFVLDEGLAITKGLMPGVAGPIAMIGIAEKGYMTLELSVETAGGHSSMPPAETTIGILSRALDRLETHPMPGGIGGVIREMFQHAGPEMKPAMRMVIANLWLFGPLIKSRLAADKSTNAIMRTTTAITVIEGGLKENVLPAKARALVNFRILPGDAPEKIIEHVRKVIGDERVSIVPVERTVREASPVARTDDPSYGTMARTLREVFPEVIVAPSLVTGATDSRHFAALTGQIFRFGPFTLTKEDLPRLHGTNERISEEDYLKAIHFYARLMENGAGGAKD